MINEHKSTLTSATGNGNGKTGVIAVSQLQTSDRESQLAEAFEAYLAELEIGRHPEYEEFTADYPEIAVQLHKCLEGLELVYRGPA